MFEERMLLDGRVRLELFVRSPVDYRLACLRDGRVLVEFKGVDGVAVRSVEKLRYEFERQVEDALRQD